MMGEGLYSQQKWPGADCGSDHQLLIVKFRLKLKIAGKTTRPFRYDLKSNPLWLYSEGDEYIQGTRSDRQSAWRTMDGGLQHSTQEAVTKTIPKKKKCKKAKKLSEEALQIFQKRRQAKGKGERERYTHLDAEFQRITRGDKKPS